MTRRDTGSALGDRPGQGDQAVTAGNLCDGRDAVTSNEGEEALKNDQYGIGDYSASPTGQGCLWVAAIGVMGVLAFSYMSTYAGFPHDPLDRVENGIEGVSRPTGDGSPHASRTHHRQRRHRTVERFDE